MTIASTLRPADVISLDLRVSEATADDVSFYDSSAFRRMGQVYKGDADSVLTNTLFPKASIEILGLLESSWWPGYAGQKGLNSQKRNNLNKLVTSFDPTLLIRYNQTLIQLEVFKVVELFFSTLVTDSANVNEKDIANYDFASKRYHAEWTKAKALSDFYDIDNDATVDAHESNTTDVDDAYYDGDRRYF